MTFKPLSYKYAVPMPLDLGANARTQWVSDLIIMDPVCTWTVPDPPLVVPPEPWNVNSTYNIMMNISLPTYEVGAQVSLNTFRKLIDVLNSNRALTYDTSAFFVEYQGVERAYL